MPEQVFPARVFHASNVLCCTALFDLAKTVHDGTLGHASLSGDAVTIPGIVSCGNPTWCPTQPEADAGAW